MSATPVVIEFLGLAGLRGATYRKGDRLTTDAATAKAYCERDQARIVTDAELAEEADPMSQTESGEHGKANDVKKVNKSRSRIKTKSE